MPGWPVASPRPARAAATRPDPRGSGISTPAAAVTAALFGYAPTELTTTSE